MFLWTHTYKHKHMHTNKSFPKDCLHSNLSGVLFFCSTMRKEVLLELYQSLLHGESVLKTSAYKQTKTSIYTFGSTVLEERKRPFTGIKKKSFQRKYWKYIDFNILLPESAGKLLCFFRLFGI